MHVPVVCGASEEVMRYLEDKGFRLESLSVGREGAKPDGDPAYWVSYYLNKDNTESVSEFCYITVRSRNLYVI